MNSAGMNNQEYHTFGREFLLKYHCPLLLGGRTSKNDELNNTVEKLEVLVS